jgi:hypothetical protein
VGRTYLAVNTLRLGYKNQSVNAVQWNNHCLFSDPHKTHNYTVGRTYRAVNTLRLGYKNQSVNAVQWNSRYLFSDPHNTHTCNEWADLTGFYNHDWMYLLHGTSWIFKLLWLWVFSLPTIRNIFSSLEVFVQHVKVSSGNPIGANRYLDLIFRFPFCSQLDVSPCSQLLWCLSTSASITLVFTIICSMLNESSHLNSNSLCSVR